MSRDSGKRVFFFFSSRRRHTRYIGDWSSDVCSSDLTYKKRNTVLVQRAALRFLYVSTLKQKWFDDERSEERRVGKECRSRWSQKKYKKKYTEIYMNIKLIIRVSRVSSP